MSLTPDQAAERRKIEKAITRINTELVFARRAVRIAREKRDEPWPAGEEKVTRLEKRLKEKQAQLAAFDADHG